MFFCLFFSGGGGNCSKMFWKSSFLPTSFMRIDALIIKKKGREDFPFLEILTFRDTVCVR